MPQSQFELRRKLLQLEALYDIGRALNTLRPEGELLEELMHRAVATLDAMTGFKMMEQYYNLKLLPDETVDGKSTFVLEMTLKDKQAGIPIGKSKLYYDKATGIAIKSISYDDKDKPSGTMTTSDIKIDANIPADHFVFKVPVGVEVKDETKGT